MLHGVVLACYFLWLVETPMGQNILIICSAYHSVRKVSDLIFFYENLVDFNEVRLYEVFLNLHMHVWIFSSLSVATVDVKQHLSEVVF